MDEAVALGADLLAFFEGRSVRVIRLGLHASETLEADRVAGIYHPAFRELCEGERYRRVLDGLLAAHPPGGVTLLVPPGHASKVTGQGRCNLLPYEKRGFRLKVCADASVPPFSGRVVKPHRGPAQRDGGTPCARYRQLDLTDIAPAFLQSTDKLSKAL